MNGQIGLLFRDILHCVHAHDRRGHATRTHPNIHVVGWRHVENEAHNAKLPTVGCIRGRKMHRWAFLTNNTTQCESALLSFASMLNGKFFQQARFPTADLTRGKWRLKLYSVYLLFQYFFCHLLLLIFMRFSCFQSYNPIKSKNRITRQDTGNGT